MEDKPLDSDLPHDPDAVAKQLAYSEVMGSYLMTGFVKAFEDEFHTAVSKPVVMGLLRPADVPATSKLAAHYTVCDNWFACIPTSTAPNRLMSMCGFTNHRDTGVLLRPDSCVRLASRSRREVAGLRGGPAVLCTHATAFTTPPDKPLSAARGPAE
jgi:hypothetical protein